MYGYQRKDNLIRRIRKELRWIRMTKGKGRITKKKLKEILQFDGEKFHKALTRTFTTKYIPKQWEYFGARLVSEYLELIKDELGL